MADLFSPLKHRLRGCVDVILFNPPYVPTSDEELDQAVKCGDVSAAWAGGIDGRRVIDRVLPQVYDLLRDPPKSKEFHSGSEGDQRNRHEEDDCLFGFGGDGGGGGGGCMYMVAVQENDPEAIMRFMRTRFSMQTKVVATRRVPGEFLHILRFQKSREPIAPASAAGLSAENPIPKDRDKNKKIT